MHKQVVSRRQYVVAKTRCLNRGRVSKVRPMFENDPEAESAQCDFGFSPLAGLVRAFHSRETVTGLALLPACVRVCLHLVTVGAG